MIEKLAQALDYISGRHIDEAATAKRRRRPVFLGAVAAALALALIYLTPALPMTVNATVVAAASGSLKPERPDRDDYEVWEDFRADLDVYDALLSNWEESAADALTRLTPFFTQASADYLGNTTENRVWSPVNAYMALSVLAEITEGNTRAQILDALDTDSLEALRHQTNAIWEEVNWERDQEIVQIANSLWLNEDLNYVQETMDTLGREYHTDIYQADLGSRKAEKALQAWLNNNTGGLLRKNVAGVAFPPEAVLTLTSTVYFQSKWSTQFNPIHNTHDVFHAPEGDITTEYMNRKEIQTNYYWGESFGAVNLWLKNNCKMWLILPDEDKTVDDVLQEGEYLTILPPKGEDDTGADNHKYMKVNLSMPKFDITDSGNIAEVLQNAGITDVFQYGTADFSALTADTPVYLTGANQATRVIVDEEGVKAASYIEFPGAGAAMPPEEIIDFVLDRPFIFVIADTSGIPLFTGVVNQP